MATHHRYAYEREVRFKLELTQRRNTLIVTGDLTAEGVRFFLDSGIGLLDSRQVELVVDMRAASASSEHFVKAVAWIVKTAEARGKRLTVLAVDQIQNWLRDAGVQNVRSDLFPEMVS